MAGTLMQERMAREPENRHTPSRGLSLGMGVLLIVGAAGLWIIALVLFHALTAWLLR
jgi:hypothetical protein